MGLFQFLLIKYLYVSIGVVLYIEIPSIIRL